MSERFADRKGGDKWKSKGENGIWHRIHTKPRRARFTPFKIAKGPNSKEKLGSVRFTKGVSQSGKTFEFHDNWLDPKNAHKTFDESWVGCTTFVVQEKTSLFDVQLGRSTSTVEDSTEGNGGNRGEGTLTTRLKCADIFDDE